MVVPVAALQQGARIGTHMLGRMQGMVVGEGRNPAHEQLCDGPVAGMELVVMVVVVHDERLVKRYIQFT